MKGFWFFVRTAAESSRELPVVRRPPAHSRERQASRRLARKKRYGNTECRRLKGSQLLPCSLIVRKERKAMRMDSRSRIALPPCVGFPKCFAVCVFLYVSWVFKIRYKFPLTTMRIGSWRKGGMRGVEARRLMAFCRGRRPRLRLPGVARTGGVGGAWPLRRGAEVRLARRSSQKILRRHSSLEWLLPQARPAPSMLVGGVGRSLALRWPAVPAGCVGTGRRFSGGGQRRALGP